LNGINGFTININGVNANSGTMSVSWLGDINGDSIDDIIIGSSAANSNSGQDYVLFGSK
jgi:hypothetical protein